MRIGSPKVRDIVIQGGEAAFGNSNIVNKCIDNGYMFLFRGMHTNSARKYAKRIKGMGRNKEEAKKSFTQENSEAGKIFGTDHRIIRVIVFRHVKRNGKRTSNTGIS
jgi:hypothetical protein